ncbi:relaxase/mobilization nuclease domain-containing protein [Pararhizobium arenae]|uniref:relaxase/mobilization nuclease domain-containing protein n=1 Tax=Pararhizobium arenae TaxID=1856850 RepID=UPI00094ABB26|nr:relaxase/mobilization nuclease domain-containing protein [Pararhizobium arenae]
MAYDWSGLLEDIKSSVVRRAISLLDEEEERRRQAGALRIAMAAEPLQRRSMPSGILRKSRMATVCADETTIDALLRPARAAPQDIIALVETLGANVNAEMEEERRRSGGGGGGRIKGAGIVPSLAARPSAAKPASAQSTSRAAIAAGAQPVVIKVTSTVSSRASAAGLMTYLGTREVEKENGEKGKADIPIFDQEGRAIASREQRAAALQDWLSEFREPYAVDAVATLSIKLAEAVGNDTLHDALNAAFATRPFLYSRHPDGSVSVYAVTNLPAKKIAGALRTRKKEEGPARMLDKAEADIAGRMSHAGVLATVRIVGAAVSGKSGRYFLEKFLRTEKHVVTSAGEPVKRGVAVKDIADEVWRGWAADIRTVEPRNAFHVIFSARAGTDADAMNRAVRDFLSEQVAGHRWITAHHPDTSHVHVHAMISARDDVGKALRLTKPELYAWREQFAAKAREHGIAMVATRRADVAATRPYSQAQAGASERGRIDPRYLKSAAVHQRVERKRAGVVDRASLANGSLGLAPNWRATAAVLKQAGAKPSVIEAADRFAAAAAGQVQKIAAQPAKGFVLVRVAVEHPADPGSVVAAIQSAIGVGRENVAIEGRSILLLMPTSASVSKIERELARHSDGISPGAETNAVAYEAEARLMTVGLKAAVTVEAAGSAKDGMPTAWLRNRLDAHRRRAQPAKQLAEIMTSLLDLKQQKENAMALSLDQFDERVARANKSIDRLEGMVDSSTERQAVDAIRREISALFEEQRRDLEMRQLRSVEETAGSSGTRQARGAEEGQRRDQPAVPTIDPAITAQQQAIAAARAARAIREQAETSKNARDEQRSEILRRAEEARQRESSRSEMDRD